jgi:hypothetical protein
MSYALTVLRILACAFGVILIYAALFLYEDEQNQIQSTLEDWWITIDEHSRKAVSTHELFTRKVATLASTVFDKLFGTSLISPKFLGASASYPIASFLFVQATYFVFYADDLQISVPPSTYLVTFAFVVFFVVLGSFHIRINTPSGLKTWYLIVFMCDFGLITVIMIASGFSQHFIARMIGYVMLGLMIGIASDALFILLTRRILRWTLSASFVRSIGVIIGNTIFAFVLIVFPFLLSRWLPPWQSGYSSNMFMDILSAALIVDSFSNLPIAFSGGVFVLLALGMLLHKTFWPILNRPIYALQSLGIARRSKLLGTIGLILIGSSIGVVPSWVKEVVDKLLR